MRGPLLVLLFLLLSLPLHAQEFRAFWVDAFHDGFKTSTQVTQLISRLRAANCNAAIVEVRKRGDAYYRGNFEPLAADIAPDYDPLQDLINQAHDTNAGPRIEIHAWLVTYPIWNNRTSPPPQPTHPYNLHPDWLSQDYTNNQWNGNYSFDPAHPAVQEHTYNVALDIVQNYDVDGINFDYIRYPEQGAGSGNNPWGYNPVSVARFNRLYNRAGTPFPADSDWLQFRRDQITALLRRVYLGVLATRPAVTVSADTITWAPGVTTDSEWLTSAAPYNRVLQDWRGWMEEGILDLNIPMAYFRQNTGYATDYAKWIQFAKDRRYGRHVAIGPGIYLNSISNGIHQMRLSREQTPSGNRADGVCGYSYAVPASNVIANLQSVFLSALTQPSAYDSVSPPIFATPAPVPAMPWKTSPDRGHLRGFVRDYETAAPFDGLTLTLAGSASRQMLTDGNGFYGAVNLLPGSYSISIANSGYETILTNIVISAGRVATCDLRLVPRRTPTITVQPISQAAPLASTVTFEVTATGPGTLVYAWLKDGAPLPNRTGLSLVLTNIQPADEGVYSVLVRNEFGVTPSSGASLTVTLPFNDLRVIPGHRAAIVSWATPVPSTSQVEYYTGANPHLFTPASIDPGLTHSVLLSGLTPGLQYCVIARAAWSGRQYSATPICFQTVDSLILDNPDASFVGAWTAGTASSDKFQIDYHFASTVTGSATKAAVYTPLIPTPGLYDVYVWYPAGGNRSAAAPHVITFSGGSETVLVNQQIDGGAWRLLAAARPFALGTNGSVQILNNTGESGKVVLADGIRFVYSAGQEPPAANTVPQWWASFYLGTTTPDPNADPDHDGYPNCVEFLLGTDPANPGSRLEIWLERTPVHTLAFTPFLSDRIYRVQARPNFDDPWQTLTNTPVTGLAGRGSIFLPDTNGVTRFFRLQVHPAP